jgi:two-component system CheB/CheR fusion protein
MDGYAVAKAIRRLPAICDTFLVALTGYALPDDQRRATEAGFDAHVIKPASIDAMEEVLARAPARELARGAPPLS